MRVKPRVDLGPAGIRTAGAAGTMFRMIEEDAANPAANSRMVLRRPPIVRAGGEPALIPPIASQPDR